MGSLTAEQYVAQRDEKLDRTGEAPNHDAFAVVAFATGKSVAEIPNGQYAPETPTSMIFNPSHECCNRDIASAQCTHVEDLAQHEVECHAGGLPPL